MGPRERMGRRPRPMQRTWRRPPIATGPGEVWRPLPGASYAARAHSEGGREQSDPAHRGADVRGETLPTCGGDGAERRLRTGLLGLFVRLSARTQRAWCTQRTVATGDADPWWLGLVLFGRFARERMAEFCKKPETLEFLGFKHVCGTDRNGKVAIVRVPSTKSPSRASPSGGLMSLAASRLWGARAGNPHVGF